MQLVFSLTGLDSVVSVHTNDNIFSCLVESKLVKLETSHTVFFRHMLSVLLSLYEAL